MIEKWVERLYQQGQEMQLIVTPLLVLLLLGLIVLLLWYRSFRSQFVSDPKSRRSRIHPEDDLEPWEAQRKQMDRAYRAQHELWDFVSGRRRRRPPPGAAPPPGE